MPSPGCFIVLAKASGTRGLASGHLPSASTESSGLAFPGPPRSSQVVPCSWKHQLLPPASPKPVGGRGGRWHHQRDGSRSSSGLAGWPLTSVPAAGLLPGPQDPRQNGRTRSQLCGKKGILFGVGRLRARRGITEVTLPVLTLVVEEGRDSQCPAPPWLSQRGARPPTHVITLHHHSHLETETCGLYPPVLLTGR